MDSFCNTQHRCYSCGHSQWEEEPTCLSCGQDVKESRKELAEKISGFLCNTEEGKKEIIDYLGKEFDLDKDVCEQIFENWDDLGALDKIEPQYDLVLDSLP
jgi:hypothetical protein